MRRHQKSSRRQGNRREKMPRMWRNRMMVVNLELKNPKMVIIQTSTLNNMRTITLIQMNVIRAMWMKMKI